MREEALLGKVGGESPIRRSQLIRFGVVIIAGGNRTILGLILLPALLLGEGSSANEKLQVRKNRTNEGISGEKHGHGRWNQRKTS